MNWAGNPSISTWSARPTCFNCATRSGFSIGNLPPFWEIYFYRTQTGTEIDVLLLPPGGKPPVAVEIKYSSSPSPSRGLYDAMRDLNCAGGYIVCSCESGFRLDDRLMVLPVEQVRDIFSGSGGSRVPNHPTD